ncbi:MAG: ABC transporter permease [Verrucomicrobiales bacterium]|nr:ABC transporter permease [Verrucomicrobiales bacterium]
MNWLHKLRLRLRALFQKEKLDARMDDEMRSHIEMQTQENIDAGMKPEEARYDALRQFGWVESIKETCREQRGVSWIENLGQDIRYGARMLRKNPGFTAVAVLTLALGIGANTAIFSVVNAVLLKPLPYPESERLLWLGENAPNFPTRSIAYPNFLDWRAQQTAFENLGVYNFTSVNLTSHGEPVRLEAARISAGVFPALRIQPALGRFFTEEEDRPGVEPVLMLGHALWQSRFGGDADVLNQSLNIDGRPYSVVGVMPAGFAFPGPVDVWTPVGLWANDGGYKARGSHPGLFAVARLKPSVSLEQARSEMNAIAARLEQEYPDSNKQCGIRVDSLLENRVGNVSQTLWILLGAVALVLLIACGNVASLLLSRAAARQREMAVRAALGAGRWRIVRQLLCESLLLAALGGGLGLLLANWGLRLILAISLDSLPRAAEIHLDSGVLVFTAGLALLTGFVFGLVPAWQAGCPRLQGVLKDAARGVVAGRTRLHHGLVVGEVALTLLLLIGAGLLLRSFYRLQTQNPGFSGERVLTFRLDVPDRKYRTVDQQVGFFQNLVEKLRALPGVENVGVTYQFPLNQQGWRLSYQIEGQPEPPPEERRPMELTPVSPDYFGAMGIPLQRGRTFTDQDNREHLRNRDLSGLNFDQNWIAGINVIIVDREFARRHWPDEDPIGKRVFVPWSPLPWGQRGERWALTVVGVVERVKQVSLNDDGGVVQAYLSAWQASGTDRSVVLKTTVAPSSLFNAVRQQVRALDPEQPIYDLRAMDTIRHDSLAPQRLNLVLLGLFAMLALILAGIGLYGVLAFAVSQRTREIGVRTALGAQRSDVIALVLGHGMKLAGVGVLLGLAGAFGLTRLIRALLFDVTPTDTITFATIPLLLATVALLACWLPARRAAKVDPMVALRYE